MFHYGVVFRVDPSDVHSFTALLPLVDDNDVKASRNVTEACRVAADLMTVYPELLETFRDRTLVISMVSSYKERDRQLRRVVVHADDWNQHLEKTIDA